MANLKQLVDAALDRNAVLLRALTMEFLDEHPHLSAVPYPATTDQTQLAVAAALIELLASRRSQLPPTWTASVGGIPEPFFMLQSAMKMPRLRRLCEAESPEPLKKRGLYAPPNFLELV